jgi:hypothetical protein
MTEERLIPASWARSSCEMPLACRSRRRLAAKASRRSRGSIRQADPAVAYQPTALKQQNVRRTARRSAPRPARPITEEMDLGKIAAIPARSPDFGSGRVRINSAGAPRAGLLPPLSPDAPQGCPRAHAPICAERPVRSPRLPNRPGWARAQRPPPPATTQRPPQAVHRAHVPSRGTRAILSRGWATVCEQAVASAPGELPCPILAGQLARIAASPREHRRRPRPPP